MGSSGFFLLDDVRRQGVRERAPGHPLGEQQIPQASMLGHGLMQGGCGQRRVLAGADRPEDVATP